MGEGFPVWPILWRAVGVVVVLVVGLFGLSLAVMADDGGDDGEV